MTKHRPDPDRDAVLYLKSVTRKIHLKKGTIIKLADHRLAYFCIVLKGVVGGYEWNNGTDPNLREIIRQMDYFTGTIHPFTQRNRLIEYRTLTPVILARMHMDNARHGQLQYPDLTELFHVMKQHKINQLRQQVIIFQEFNHAKRYQLYTNLLPDWQNALPDHIQREFLQISKAHYHRLKNISLNKR